MNRIDPKHLLDPSTAILIVGVGGCAFILGMVAAVLLVLLVHCST